MRSGFQNYFNIKTLIFIGLTVFVLFLLWPHTYIYTTIDKSGYSHPLRIHKYFGTADIYVQYRGWVTYGPNRSLF
jgi:uncharacterized membrane protein